MVFDGNCQFGNKAVDLRDLLRLADLCGPIGEDDEDHDAIYLKVERQQFTRPEVMELLQIIARMDPDECEMDGDELRLWWD